MSGPHTNRLGSDASAKELLLASLFDHLWQRYRSQVPFVQTYEEVAAAAGAEFVNDHIAFRTLASQQPLTGIPSLSRLFEALDYRVAGSYGFTDKHLSALHLQHANPVLPKLFISELRLWELPAEARQAAAASLESYSHPLDNEDLAALTTIDGPTDLSAQVEKLSTLFQRPWSPPEKSAVEALEQVSQYGAWTLLHGYAVNHFTSLVNSHQVPTLDSIDKTVAALQAAGVPMKSEIEGAPGSKLRQTATAAASCDVEILERGKPSSMSWTYAYFEIAERGEVKDPDTGKSGRFEGFLGPQATQLFEMTKSQKPKNK